LRVEVECQAMFFACLVLRRGRMISLVVLFSVESLEPKLSFLCNLFFSQAFKILFWTCVCSGVNSLDKICLVVVEGSFHVGINDIFVTKCFAFVYIVLDLFR
jgi:hypothetical protein